MSQHSERVRDDFDRIAQLTAGDADRLSPCESLVIGLIPPELRSVLEVGCGAGAFSRALAARGHEVTAVDLSPEMIAAARARAGASHRVTYVCGDFDREPPEGAAFDCVVSVAALHHMPREAAVRRMARLVRPGGLLVVHDLRADASARDYALLPLAVAARWWAVLRGGRRRESAAVRAAWREHGRHERYETMAQVRDWSRELLPGSRALRHLQWRYTVLWRRPAAPGDSARDPRG